MAVFENQLTEAQDHLVGALDDAVEHVMWEWDKPDPHGIGTCGFAHITNIDGRSSFVQRVKSLAKSDNTLVTQHRGRQEYEMSVGSLELSLRPAHDSGYRLSITNVTELVGGPAHQRLDVRKELHRLLLHRLRSRWDYLGDARIYSRMD